MGEGPRRRVEGRLQVFFHGDYFESSELPDQVDTWIDGGFCDRDNLYGYRFEADVTELCDGQPVYLTEWSRETAWRLLSYDPVADEETIVGSPHDSREAALGARDSLKARYPELKIRIARMATVIDVEDESFTGEED